MRQNERFKNAVLGKPADRLPFFPIWGPWEQTLARWRDQGMARGEDWLTLPGFDNQFKVVPVNYYVCPAWPEEVLEENEETLVKRNWQGITMRVLKKGNSMPEFLDYPVKDRASWRRFKAERLDPNHPGRFPKDWEDQVKDMRERDYPLLLGWYPCGFFGTARDLMGVEEFLVQCALDPEFIDEINSDLCDFWYVIWNKALDCLDVDAVMLWEDMAGKQGSLISPAMFRRFMTPYYRKLIGLARDRGAQIAMVDSDGYAEELAGLFAEAGVNLFFPFEAQAGNDLMRIRHAHPELGMMGGMDKRVLAQGKAEIDAEMERIRPVIEAGRYIPCPDHMIPPDAKWENWLYFARRWKEAVYGEKR